MKKTFFTKSDLKIKRKWTDKLIEKYLKKPDLVKRNPIYKCASDMSLYDLDRIIKIESKSEFKLDFEKRMKRLPSSKKAVETKTNKLLSLVEEMEIKIHEMDRDTLYLLIFEQYNTPYRADNKWISMNTDEATLAHIAVDFVFFNLTSYDYHLYVISSKVGTDIAYLRLITRIYTLIIEKYPYLEEECRRQLIAKGGGTIN